jgi:hypothetical protein
MQTSYDPPDRPRSASGQYLLKPCIEPRADREGHFERLDIEHDLQGFPGGIENHTASAAARDVLLQRLPELSGAISVDIAGEILQH